MQRALTIGTVLGLLTPLAVGAARAQNDDGEAPRPPRRFDLRRSYVAKLGDRTACEATNKTEVLVTLKRQGAPIRVENKQQGHEMRFVDEVTGVTPDGGVTRIRRTYTYVKDFGNGVEDRRRRVVNLSWETGAFRFEKESELHPTAEELLSQEEERPQGVYDALIPARPVPVGHRWKIPNAPAAQLFLFDPEDLVEARSRCGGQLHSLHPRRDVDVLRVVLHFDLTFARISEYGLDFTDRPLKLQCAFSIWDGYGSPYTSTTFQGVTEGEAKYEREDIPKDVSCFIRVAVTGKYKSKPAEDADWH